MGRCSMASSSAFSRKRSTKEIAKRMPTEEDDNVTRIAALRPNGPISRRFLSQNVIVLVVGDSIFVHGRKFSDEVVEKCDCSTLEHVLSTVPGVKRMIMGHTIQTVGINGVCDNRTIQIDVGMSKGCGGGLPDLEINGTFGLRILTSNPLYQNKGNASGFDVGKEKGLGFLLTEQDRPKQVEVKA
ncbi:Metallo-dependent phosphatase-like [Sesbania bispinosa]|nr:Metallo-dependent phosphatase-like [Sesbania bispinosa]